MHPFSIVHQRHLSLDTAQPGAYGAPRQGSVVFQGFGAFFDKLKRQKDCKTLMMTSSGSYPGT